MKRILRQICGAGFYFAIYLGVQLGVSIAASLLGSFLIGLEVGMDAALSGGAIDGTLGADDITEIVMERMSAWLNDAMVPILIASQLLTLLLLWLTFLLRRRPMLHEIACEKAAPLPLGLAFLLGICTSCLVQTAFAVIPFPPSWMESYAESSAMLTEAPLWLLTISSVILAPLVEETVFRGLVYTRLRRVMPAWVTIVITSALFGVMHGNFVWFLYTSFLGALIAVMLERCGSLLMPILIHFGFNLAGSFLGYLVGEELEMIELIVLAVIGVLGTVGSAILLWRIGKKPDPVPSEPPIEPLLPPQAPILP